MKDSSNKILITLSEIDKEIEELTRLKEDAEKRSQILVVKLDRFKQRLGEVDASYQESASRQKIEEHRLKDEETKIVERRKQLTALGGAKSAKLVERELDIASRVMESMEKNAMDAMVSAERLEREKTLLEERVAALEAELKKVAGESEESLANADKQLGSLGKKRDTQLEKLSDRLKNLYNKVNTRYPGDAIAITIGGACQSCYRSLPAQTYNQVIAGNVLLQCPGCSRILIYGGDSASEARA
ncbi:MAG: hypothetical protein KDD69_17665 [Bdellovibrionales bacterium]|nr:hypothetical protein [Bdellovibrionales bacterium]